MDSEAERERASALRQKEHLLRLVGRRKQSRLAWTLVLAVAGTAVLFFKPTILFAPACFLGAVIMLLLFLEAREHLQEIKTRPWASATPRVSRLTSADDAKAKDAPAGP
jgi:hypothetical protein